MVFLVGCIEGNLCSQQRVGLRLIAWGSKVWRGIHESAALAGCVKTAPQDGGFPFAFSRLAGC